MRHTAMMTKMKSPRKGKTPEFLQEKKIGRGKRSRKRGRK